MILGLRCIVLSLCLSLPLAGPHADEISDAPLRSDSVKPLSDPNGAWVLVPALSDEFGGTEVDTTKWSTNVPSWGVWSWDARDVAERDGMLVITADYRVHTESGRTKYYDVGIARSRNTLKYGYFEARIRGAARLGVSSAFWASYSAGSGEHTEIDFVEINQNAKPDVIDTNTHVFRHAGLDKPLHESHHWELGDDPTSDFHVYGCEWTDAEIRWYVDGVLVRRRSNDYWDQGLWITLSAGLRKPLTKEPDQRGFPTHMLVDYVRVWQRPEGGV